MRGVGGGEHEDRLPGVRLVVVIPTYNNAGTLCGVVRAVQTQGLPVLLVNDGSTDGTEDLLAELHVEELISYRRNRGKGYALNRAFGLAVERGYTHALTFDADGQHHVEDLQELFRAAVAHPAALILGSRDLRDEGMPARNSFGNRFSNFWVLANTGCRLPDTQTGLRVYPLAQLRRPYIRWPRYEGELEVLVKACWRGVEVRSVPVRVHYEPKATRVSHFRPFMDSMRIAALNCTLVPQALVYYLPRRILQSVHRKGFKAFVREDVLGASAPARVIALSVGIGLFFSCSPFWGFQWLLAFVVAKLCRVNPYTAFLASNASIPPVIPFLLYAEFLVGALLLGRGLAVPSLGEVDVEYIRGSLVQFVVGSLFFALVVGTLGGLLVYGGVRLYRRNRGI